MSATQRLNRSDLLVHALEIAREYAGNLTLRQLYYQLVARGYSPNSQRDYKRIGSVVAKARMSGAFPFDWLLDRTRTVHPGRFTTYDTDVDDALDKAAGALRSTPYWYLSASRWFGQREHVSVWVEKEALAGVFEDPCERLGVSWFTCKGYPSLSALYEWVKQIAAVVDASRTRAWGDRDGMGLERVTILYFGDHDPDGWQIPRSALENVRTIAAVEGLHLPWISLERVALNMPQIEAFNPPPFPAKMTSSRYQGYVDEHGTDDAWELDALRPEQLQQLIRDNVEERFDREVYSQHQATITRLRADMRSRMQDPVWMSGVLEDPDL